MPWVLFFTIVMCLFWGPVAWAHPDEALWTALDSQNGTADESNELAFIQALKAGANVHAKNDSGQTPLQIAIEQKSLKKVALLLQYGAKLEHSSEDNNSSLYQAAYTGHLEMTRLILAQDPEHTTSETAQELLEAAILGGNPAILELFLQAGMDVQDKKSTSLLHKSLSSPEMLNLLLNKGYLLESQNEKGYTPLLQAVDTNQWPAAQLLLERKASLQARGNGGETALMLAAQTGNLSWVSRILKLEPSLLNIQDQDGETALLYAAGDGHIDTIQYLQAQGENPLHKSRSGLTVLHKAALSGKQVAVTYALGLNISPQLQDVNGMTPLNYALMPGEEVANSEVIKRLLEAGAPVNLTNDQGIPLFMQAAADHNVEILSLLWGHGADIQAKNKAGEDTLLWLLKQKNTYISDQVIRFLLEKGANPRLPDATGKTALDWGLKTQNPDLIFVLLDYGLNPQSKTENDESLLVLAARKGHLALFQSLLKRGLPLTETSPDGEDLLTVSLQGNNEKLSLYLIQQAAPHFDLDQALVQSAECAETSVVKALLLAGADVNAQDSIGTTALMNAAKCGNVPSISLLLEKGADLHRKDSGQRNAFLHAAICSDVETLRFLLAQGAQLHSQTKAGANALHLAAYNQHLESVKALVELGLAVDSRDDNEQTPLFWALEEEHENVVAWLLKAKANPNHQDQDGVTPLALAMDKENPLLLQLLVKAGADLYHKDSNGMNLMEKAIVAKNPDMVKALLELGFRVEYKDDLENTPLLKAVQLTHPQPDDSQDQAESESSLNERADSQKSQLEMIGILLKAGANPKITDSLGVPALYLLAESGNLEAFQLLEKQTGPIQIKTYFDQGILHYAVRGNDPQLVSYVLKNKPLLEQQDKEKRTPLLEAFKHRAHAVIPLLLEAGADPNKADMYGHTALFYALATENLPLIESLLKKGADIHFDDKKGNTVILFAMQSKNMALLPLLEKYGSNLRFLDEYGHSLLFSAVYWNNLEYIKYLQKKGLSINHLTNYGASPLSVAVLHGHVEIYRYLISQGANTQAKSSVHPNLLMAAAMGGNSFIFEDLLKRKIAYSLEQANEQGWTILRMAAWGGNEKIFKFLLNKGAKIKAHAQTKSGETWLMTAARGGNWQIFQTLLKRGEKPEWNRQNKNGHSLLMFAVLGGNRQLVEYLLKNGASLNLVDQDGDQALALAAETGDSDMVKLLVQKGAPLKHLNKKGQTAADRAHEKGYDELFLYLITEAETEQKSK